MNNISDFLKNNFHVILFFILQIVCIILITNNMQYSSFVLSRASQHITGPIYNTWSKVTRHFNLNAENQYLVEQNIQLMRQSNNNFMFKDDSLYSAFVMDSTISKRKKTRMYDYTYANVIYKTTHNKHNYIIIDKGSEDGITTDMAVISAQGVVGVVNEVSTHFSSIISILHPDSRISAKIMPINQIGTVLWSERDPRVATLHDIPQHLEVNIGDSVFTSGFSNVFPKDILVGTVIEKKNNTKNSFFTIEIELATNFNNINTVYLVSNLYKSEIDSIKSNFKDE